MDAGGRATQDAKAEGARRVGEGVSAHAIALSPSPSPINGRGELKHVARMKSGKIGTLAPDCIRATPTNEFYFRSAPPLRLFNPCETCHDPEDH